MLVILLISIGTVVWSADGCENSVTITSGDTCWAIAKHINKTVDELKAMNPNIECHTLQPGQRLCVSGTASESNPSYRSSECAKWTTVASDETCWKIAERTGKSLEQLKEINPTVDCDRMRPGQKLCVKGISSVTPTDSGPYLPTQIMPTSSNNGRSERCSRRVVGYITSWSIHPFTDAQASRLTHLIFAFVPMREHGELALSTAERNRLNSIMEVARRHSHLKVMFAVGGWTNSKHFSGVAKDDHHRKVFVKNIATMVEEFGFDGVDIDWEYPVTGGDSKGTTADRNNYVSLMRELRQRFDNLEKSKSRQERYLISFAGPAGMWNLKPGYDLVQLMKYADFVNVMTYDYNGAWHNNTGPLAPLYSSSSKGCVHSTLQYYSCKLKATDKINMGVPFYGRFWRNAGDATNPSDGMWRKATTDGGEVTWRDLPFRFDIGQSRFHEESKTPYIFMPSRREFVGYDNPQSLRHKSQYAVDKNLGGIMIWAIDQDDDQLTLLTAATEGQFCQSERGNRRLAYECPSIV